jgi:putative ABC transport system permease protein
MGRFWSSLKTAFFIASRDVGKNAKVLAVVLLALGFLFTNLLFARFIVLGFRDTLEYDVIKVSGAMSLVVQEEQEEEEDKDISKLASSQYNLEREEADYLQDAPLLEKRISELPGVIAATSTLNSSAMLKHGTKEVPAMILGFPPDDKVTVVSESIVKGRYFEPGYTIERESGIVLGRYLAEKLAKKRGKPSLEPGDVVRVIFRNSRLKRYTVRGVIDVRDYEVNYNAILPRDELQAVLKTKPGEASEILIKVNDKHRLPEIKTAIATFTNPKGHTETWEEKDDIGLPDLVSGFNLVGQIIFGVGLLSSAIVIAVVIYINAIRKRRQIGIIRAIGIRNWLILLVFSVQALLLAVFGVGTGTGLYYLLDRYLHQHPIVMPFGDMATSFQLEAYLVAVALFLATAVCAGLYPAWIITREPIAQVTAEIG